MHCINGICLNCQLVIGQYCVKILINFVELKKNFFGKKTTRIKYFDSFFPSPFEMVHSPPCPCIEVAEQSTLKKGRLGVGKSDYVEKEQRCEPRDYTNVEGQSPQYK